MYFADILRRLFLLTLLMCAAWSDVASGKISNRLVFFGFCFCGSFNCFFPPHVSWDAIIMACLILFVLVLLWKRGLTGGGDVKLLILLIFVLPDDCGLRIFVTSFPFALASWIILFSVKGIKSIPFAVSVLSSAVLVFVEELIK